MSEAGEPLAGARVYLSLRNRRYEDFPNNTEPGAPLRVRAVTDSEGRFDFVAEDAVFTDLDGLPTRRFCMIYAEADGYGIDWLGNSKLSRRSPHYRDDAGRDLTLRLPIDDTPLRARLVDLDGLPLAGVRVTTRTLTLPKNRDLDAHLARIRRMTAETKAFPDSFWATVILSPCDFGKALNLESGSLPPSLQTQTTTDIDGWFTLTGFGRDRFVNLRVEKPGIEIAYPSVTTRPASEELTNGSGRTIELGPDCQIRGQVVDADTGEPIAGMRVGLGRSRDGIGYPRDGVLFYGTASDANGWFAVTGISPERKSEIYVVAESAPGMTYQSAGKHANRDTLAFGNSVSIACRRGIPFQLAVTNEAGLPVVEAEVFYEAIIPNPHAQRGYCSPHRRNACTAAARGEGVYEGFVFPGPGAIFIRTPGRTHRVASVDPKAYFAPERTDWTSQEKNSTYGNTSSLNTGSGYRPQADYSAIVLVNPVVDSGPLEIQATVYPDRTRQVALLDSDGRPLTGVQVRGLPSHGPYDWPAVMRTATLTTRRLPHDRETGLHFRHKEKQLSAFLRVRGDSDEPLAVRLRPWGVLRGRVLNEQGEPLAKRSVSLSGDAVIGYHGTKTNRRGEFRIEGLTPGEAYDLSVSTRHRRNYGAVTTDLKLEPGETRDLGALRVGLLDER